MSEFFYIAIIIIMSPTQVDVIYNQVSVTEFKQYQAGKVTRKSYENSLVGFGLLGKEMDAFKGENPLDQCFMDLSGLEGGGWLQQYAAGLQMLGTADVKAYAADKGISKMQDKDLVAMVQEKLIKGVKRE